MTARPETHITYTPRFCESYIFDSFLVWDGSDEQHQTAQVLHLINLQMIWDDTELLKMTPEKYKSYGFGDLQLHTWGT